MSTKTGIEWTDATWNPIRGCSRVSEGCRNCYAETRANRFCGPGSPYEGVVQIGADGKGNGKWNGEIKFVEKHLLDPLKWKTPRRIFVNSMSDLFHEKVTDEIRDKIFAVMALCPQHTFQVLTKRPERMLAYLTPTMSRYQPAEVFDAADEILIQLGRSTEIDRFTPWPLPNVQLGVSVEDQKMADERIPLLLETPAAVRFISAEPLLDSVKLLWKWVSKGHPLGGGPMVNMLEPWLEPKEIPGLDWVIVGGESGPGARPMHPDWARSLRDQCVAAGVPFFFKQWGEWGWEEPIRRSATPEDAGMCYGPFRPTCTDDRRMMCRAYPAVIPGELGKDDRSRVMVQEGYRIGKKAAGRLLDGREWNEVPI